MVRRVWIAAMAVTAAAAAGHAQPTPSAPPALPPLPAPQAASPAAPMAIPGVPPALVVPPQPSLPPGVGLPVTPAASPSLPRQEARAPGYRSILFSEADMVRVYASTQTYRLNLARAKELASRQGRPLTPEIMAQAQQAVAPPVAEKPRSVEHPQFFLALIAYTASDNWTLWMNNHKYTAATPEFGDVKVLGVGKSRARFAWRPRFFIVYEDRLPANADTDQVDVKKEDGLVEFTLSANQSFSAYTMRVTEGFLPPVKVEEFVSALNVNSDSNDALPPAGRAPTPPRPVGRQ